MTDNLAIIEDKKRLDIFFNTADFEAAQRQAKMIAQSNFVPERFRGNIGDCVIALDMAQRLEVSPITVLQELYIIYGSPGFTSKFIIALVNMRGGYAHDLKFCRTKDDCYAWTTDKSGEKLIGPTVTMDMARAEGWLDKKGSKWQTMPEVMLNYRAASFFAKAYCPSLLLGMPSMEEIQDIIDVTPVRENSASINEDIKETGSASKARERLRDAIEKNTHENTTA